jgi:hypothetical protein
LRRVTTKRRAARGAVRASAVADDGEPQSS